MYQPCRTLSLMHIMDCARFTGKSDLQDRILRPVGEGSFESATGRDRLRILYSDFSLVLCGLCCHGKSRNTEWGKGGGPE